MKQTHVISIDIICLIKKLQFLDDY